MSKNFTYPILCEASHKSGKTYALRCFAKTLNPNLFQLSYICLSTVSVSEFYYQFGQELGIDYNSKKSVMFKNIQERLLNLLKEKRKTFILAIDESQYLSTGILRDIKMLMNTNFDSLDCFALVMIGQPYLGSVLEKPIHEALKQRIVVHYSYEGLSTDESKDYIYSRIEVAGGSRTIIDDAAVHAIANFCQGTPRLINNVMTNAFIIGAQTKCSVINTDIILSASNNLSLG
ncbi:AAA family ATPase [Clostridium sp. 19966]|nr:AAA family ATPase [Clostridium sp. 19966]